jgi:hypothetical protein
MGIAEGGCRGTRRDGTACQAPPHAIGADGFCWAHSPAKRDERRAARAKGGERRSNASRASAALPKDLADVRDALLRTLSGLEGGAVRPQTATAMAAVARALVAVQEARALERATAALETSHEWQDVRRRILAALAPYPAAKVALAEVLSAGV